LGFFWKLIIPGYKDLMSNSC